MMMMMMMMMMLMMMIDSDHEDGNNHYDGLFCKYSNMMLIYILKNVYIYIYTHI